MSNSNTKYLYNVFYKDRSDITQHMVIEARDKYWAEMDRKQTNEGRGRDGNERRGREWRSIDFGQNQ